MRVQTVLCVSTGPVTDLQRIALALEPFGYVLTRVGARQSTKILADARLLFAGADLDAAMVEYRSDPRPTVIVVSSFEAEAEVLASLRLRDDVWCAEGSILSLDLRLNRVAGGARTHQDDFYGPLEAWRANLNPALEAGVLTIDLDHFLTINQRYGIAGGDEVLQEVMRRIGDTLEPQDRATRREGDDIYVCLARKDKASVIAAAANVRECVGAKPFVLLSEPVTLTASAGLAFIDGDTVAHATRQSWLAVYMAKDSGRNDLALYDSMRDGSEDALTGVHNRRYFDTRFRRELSRATTGDEPLTLAMLDLDDFGLINKQYGHPVGDEVLRQFVRVILANVRPSDWLARYGGEEFCLVMPAMIDDASAVAERVRKAVASTVFESAGHTLHLTVSIGLMAAGSEAVTTVDMVQGASAASQRAKDAGKNRVAIAT